MDELRRNLAQYLCVCAVLLFSVELNGCSSAASDASKNTAPVVQQVAIITAESSAYVGAVLHGSYRYADSDGDGESGTVKIWLRDGKPIEGAQQDNYTVTILDSGKTLQFRVTPVAATGKSPGDAVVSSGIKIENSAPSISDVVIGGSVNGQAYTDLKLTANYNFQDFDGDGEGASTYQWLRNGVTIGGATAQTYVVTLDDIGVLLTVRVTPKDSANTIGANFVSPEVKVVNMAPVAKNVLASGKGLNKAGDVLSVSYTYSDHENDAEPITGSQILWLRDGVPIAGATRRTYTLMFSDTGKTVTAEVTPLAQTGTSPGLALVSNAVAWNQHSR